MFVKNEPHQKPKLRLSPTSKKVLLTLLYHEVFSYPLTLAEIHQRINIVDLSISQLNETVDQLVELELLQKIEGFHLIKWRPDWISKRKLANSRSKRMEPKALRRARLIAKFPFVRAVFFSGTFAKGLMTMDSDIDFFIITAEDRLWLARTLLILYKKIFLLNSRKFFCVNYFIDETRLLIEEQNLFTATEIATLRPAFGKKIYEAFRRTNSWVEKYYPNFSSRSVLSKEMKKARIKSALEFLFSGTVGMRMDAFFFKKTLLFWKRKFDWMDEDTFQIALKSKTYVSKHHPNNFQNRVLRKYHFAIEEFEKLHDVRVRLLDVA
ncbi:MAG: nucleotidyltransferase domain-containing protein [Saprospiraceae bacterium]|nr:nucleotidyltransferase domain-containing protein [Saprospiraceae bacterium]